MASSMALVALAAAVGNVAAYPTPFHDLTGRIEVQAHRGGIGMRNEESLWVSNQSKHTRLGGWLEAVGR